MILDIETDGLNAMKNRITCISCLDIIDGTIQSFCGEDEKLLLTNFWNAYEDNVTIIT